MLLLPAPLLASALRLHLAHQSREQSWVDECATARLLLLLLPLTRPAWRWRRRRQWAGGRNPLLALGLRPAGKLEAKSRHGRRRSLRRRSRMGWACPCGLLLWLLLWLLRMLGILPVSVRSLRVAIPRRVVATAASTAPEPASPPATSTTVLAAPAAAMEAGPRRHGGLCPLPSTSSAAGWART